MRTWVVTGGIATGKSTFCGLVRKWDGVAFFDCDASVHELLTKDEVTAMVARSFPDERLLSDDGGLDRNRLRDLIFSDRAKKKILEGILHPRVRENFLQTRKEVEGRGEAALLLADVPLLYESEFDIDQELEIVVGASKEVQKERLMGRSGLSETMAERMIDSQIPIPEKMARGGCVIWNDGPLASMASQAKILQMWHAF